MDYYYQRLKRITQDDGSVLARYLSSPHAQGAWNEDEQHIGAVTGVICTELEAYHPSDNMRIARLSIDILGVIPFGAIEVITQTIRAGRTIALLESSVTVDGRIYVIARAWKLMTSDTREVHGLEDDKISHPEELPNWDGMQHWGGGFIGSMIAHASPERRAGKGVVWVHTPVNMIDGQPTSDFVKLMGLVDTANGIVPRIQQDTSKGQVAWIFPNVDLQIHMHRLPEGQWLGIEAVQQIGTDGIGLTSSVLHDIHGVFGRSEQILTVRKIS